MLKNIQGHWDMKRESRGTLLGAPGGTTQPMKGEQTKHD